MRRKLVALVCALVLVTVSTTTAFAGSIHFTGGGGTRIGSLEFSGKAAGFGGEGVHEVDVKLIGEFTCGGDHGKEDITKTFAVKKGSVNFFVKLDDPECHDHFSWDHATVKLIVHGEVIDKIEFDCTTLKKDGSCTRLRK
jgi:hypothetical protein